MAGTLSSGRPPKVTTGRHTPPLGGPNINGWLAATGDHLGIVKLGAAGAILLARVAVLALGSSDDGS